MQSPSTIVFIGKNHRGQWIAQEQSGLYGGLFVSRAQAIKYALFENGQRPETIVELPREIELDMGNTPTSRSAPPEQAAFGEQAMFIPPSAWFTGFIPDLPTPFDTADTIDLKAFATLCERQVAAGVPALVVCETAGEAPTLSPAEQELFIRTAVDVARGRSRVIAGAMSNATGRAVEFARRAEAAGADTIMAVVPAYNKPMQEGMLVHFRTIAGSTGLPVILHDAPFRTLRPLADETLMRLVESRQFVGLRDGSGDTTRPMRLNRLLPSGFRLLSGDDATTFGYIAGSIGGAISEVSNIVPDLCRTIFSQVRQGRLQTARYLHKRLVPLISCLSRESPAALKYALSTLGLMSPATRLPIVPLDKAAQAEVARAFIAIADEELIDGVGA